MTFKDKFVSDGENVHYFKTILGDIGNLSPRLDCEIIIIKNNILQVTLEALQDSVSNYAYQSNYKSSSQERIVSPIRVISG